MGLAGTVEIVSDAEQASWNLGTLIYVPAVGIFLCHPDGGSVANVTEIGCYVAGIIQIEYCDVHVIEVHITSCGQACFGIAHKGSRQDVYVGYGITFCPKILEEHGLIGLAGLSRLYDLHGAGVACQQGFIELNFKP